MQRASNILTLAPSETSAGSSSEGLFLEGLSGLSYSVRECRHCNVPMIPIPDSDTHLRRCPSCGRTRR